MRWFGWLRFGHDCVKKGHRFEAYYRRGYISYHARSHFRAVACEATEERIACRRCGNWQDAPINDPQEERHEGWRIVECSVINTLSGDRSIFEAMDHGGMYVNRRWSRPLEEVSR